MIAHLCWPTQCLDSWHHIVLQEKLSLLLNDPAVFYGSAPAIVMAEGIMFLSIRPIFVNAISQEHFERISYKWAQTST